MSGTSIDKKLIIYKTARLNEYKVKHSVYGPMGSNHINLLNKLRTMLQGCYEVIHSGLNVTGVRVGDGNRTTSEAGWCGRDGIEESGGDVVSESGHQDGKGGGVAVGSECKGVRGRL